MLAFKEKPFKVPGKKWSFHCLCPQLNAFYLMCRSSCSIKEAASALHRLPQRRRRTYSDTDSSNDVPPEDPESEFHSFCLFHYFSTTVPGSCSFWNWTRTILSLGVIGTLYFAFRWIHQREVTPTAHSCSYFLPSSFGTLCMQLRGAEKSLVDALSQRHFYWLCLYYHYIFILKYYRKIIDCR